MTKSEDNSMFEPNPVTVVERKLIQAILKKDFQGADALLEEIRKVGLGNMSELDRLYAQIKKSPWVQSYLNELDKFVNNPEEYKPRAKRQRSRSRR